ncbi:unnamed protein product [Moneuplotes crassus]|uniref:Uncharacterized protein n=1 Tax=Euplotes crassus TaxID=5936 RepID=A0AAD1URI9_EUPCR|nr:unnamed protein product [Moneuplotes crassus]
MIIFVSFLFKLLFSMVFITSFPTCIFRGSNQGQFLLNFSILFFREVQTLVVVLRISIKIRDAVPNIFLNTNTVIGSLASAPRQQLISINH